MTLETWVQMLSLSLSVLDVSTVLSVRGDAFLTGLLQKHNEGIDVRCLWVAAL